MIGYFPATLFSSLLVRLGLAVAAGVLGILIRDLSARDNERSPNSTVADIIVVYGLVFLSQELLGYLRPDLALPQWAPTQGGFVGISLFTATRALFAQPPAAHQLMTEERLQQAARYRRIYSIAASLALACGAFWLFANFHRVQIAGALIVAGSLQLLWRTRGSGQLLETLQAASAWYYLGLVPASLLVLFGAKIYLYWAPLVILLFAEANQRAISANAGWNPSEPSDRPALI